MRLLLINPNTTAAITDLMAERARAIVGPETDIRAATGRFGARYIASRAAAAIAGHAALDALALHGKGCDAVLLACFGDPGLPALREVSPVPVVGMAEASCRQAGLSGRRFSIVTGGAAWGPMLAEFVAALGLSDRLASIRCVAPTGGEIAAAPDRATAMLAASCRDCVVQDGAEAVILGGAGLAGLAATVGSRVPAPVICSLAAGLDATRAAARSRPASDGGATRTGTADRLRTGESERATGADTVGLGTELAALLRRGAEAG